MSKESTPIYLTESEKDTVLLALRIWRMYLLNPVNVEKLDKIYEKIEAPEKDLSKFLGENVNENS